MTHDELVGRAVRWLRGTKRCGVVLAEVSGSGFEQPDAIGWKIGGTHSVLVECKTSRPDFLRDAKKWHRRAGLGMGMERYYLAPPGVIRAEELQNGWGLAEVGARIRVVQEAELRTRCPDRQRREIGILFAALRKAQLGLPMDRWHKEASHEPR